MPKGEYLQYGGQAIIEGVMMRSPRFFSVAVRAPNNQIVLQTEPLAKTWVGRQKWLKLPFLRGSLALLDAMALGIRAMNFASQIQLNEAYAAGKSVETDGALSKEGSDIVSESKRGGESIHKAAIGGALAFGLIIGLLLFVLLPNILGEQLRRVGVTNPTALNVASGVLKFVVFLSYIWLVSRAPEIKRVFRYHGAEHKAINTLEAEQELNLSNCTLQTRLHPRCGTSFAIVVLLVDLLALTFVPRYLVHDWSNYSNLLLRFGVNLLILPLIAGISYELIRLAGKFRSSALVNGLFWPGLMTQYLTTAEPDEGQIEVALVALRAVVDAEAGYALTNGEPNTPDGNISEGTPEASLADESPVGVPVAGESDPSQN